MSPPSAAMMKQQQQRILRGVQQVFGCLLFCRVAWREEQRRGGRKEKSVLGASPLLLSITCHYFKTRALPPNKVRCARRKEKPLSAMVKQQQQLAKEMTGKLMMTVKLSEEQRS